MGKAITSRGVGAPDFKGIERYPSRSVVSEAGIHFTDELVKDASEQENVAGLVSNKILIRNVSISSTQPLHFRLEFYSRDTFTDSDLNEDPFVGSVELDLSTYGELL